MINIYCDESCHLEHDDANSMLMGAISCSFEEKERIYREIRHIKEKHGLSTWTEIKWTSVSPSKLPFYLELIEYFVNEKALAFRAVVVKNKNNLNHKLYNNGSHDLWYYKTYYYLLDPIFDYNNEYNIFIDIKDTKSGPKVIKLHEVLCNNRYDFKHEAIKGIYQIKSHESEILQLTDLILGAIGFYHNNHYQRSESSHAKKTVVSELFRYYEMAICTGTKRGTNKFDVFLWELR
ncbi:MAG: DUF3800 domain-containing protein [Clostridia bacterium]|nr:DUF3800 domain-containing protein [Clostridia bacterium]